MYINYNTVLPLVLRIQHEKYVVSHINLNSGVVEGAVY